MSAPATNDAFRCLGFEFTVASEVAGVVEHVAAVFAPFAVPDIATHRYVVSTVASGGAEELVLELDGRELLRTDMAPVLANYLLWDVNQRVIEATPDRLLVHAGAVASGDDAVMLVGPSGAGKSTLVAGLVRAGLDYLTDELVAIDPSTGRAAPYPRAISLGAGVWDEFADVLELGDAFGGGDERHVAAQRLRAGSVRSAGSTPRVIVGIRYERAAPLVCSEMSRADALVLLAHQTFGFDASMLEPLARIVRACRCYSLVSGRLADACEAVSGLLAA